MPETKTAAEDRCIFCRTGRCDDCVGMLGNGTWDACQCPCPGIGASDA